MFSFKYPCVLVLSFSLCLSFITILGLYCIDFRCEFWNKCDQFTDAVCMILPNTSICKRCTLIFRV